MRKLCGVVFLAVLCLSWTQTAGAQTQITTGVIQGTLTDPSGAVVPGANVEVKNLDTNLTRKLATDADGRFVALLLPSGRYTVTVTKEGFAALVQENVTLTVGQTINLSLAMKVAGAEARVVVTDTPTVETVKTESSTTLNEITVGKTPILGRKFEDLLTLTPGVSIVQGPDGDEITFVGQRGIFTNISLDGGDYINGFFGEQVGGQRAAVDITVEAIKEFQVTVTGGSAEFGRTASGIVNVVTKSGTNEFHGSAFHYQRLEALTSNDSLDRPLTDFHREQSGGTLGGPIVKDRSFWYAAFEQIGGNLQRSNLSQQLGGTACPDPSPTTPPVITDPADRLLIASNADCSRLALINFIATHPRTTGQQEGNPIRRPLHNSAFFGRFDWTVTPRNQVNLSYNFNRSIKLNETFDVDTYGGSANGTEGSSRIQVVNFNLFSTITPRVLSEGHFTYNREKRPRAATPSLIPADTAAGVTDAAFAPGGPFSSAFRFGNPFFLGPDIDEIFWRTQIRDNISIVAGRHTFKVGGEWVHSLNDQVFRGFFEGRYIFDTVEGFMRYATVPSATAPAALGFGPNAGRCPDGTWIDLTTMGNGCATGSAASPLLLFLQAAAGDGGPATDAAGASNIDNEEYAIFVQDKWQIRPNFTFSYGLRWEAQILPNPTVPPSQTAYGAFLDDPRFPSDGTLPSQKKMFQPRVGISWDPWNNGKSVIRASWGIYNARQNMLSQVGSITANGVTQQTIAGGVFANPTIRPTWPGLTAPPGASSCTDTFTGVFNGVGVTNATVTNPFPCFTGVRVFKDDYRNPRIYVTNVAYEFQIARDTSVYADFTHSKGVFLTRFINFNRSGAFFTFLNTIDTTNSLGKSLYRGFTAGLRKRFSSRFQLEGNYVFSSDRDDDSNERDPFTDRNCNFNDRSLDYALSDRDIRHKFNFFAYFELPWSFEANTRLQARSAQPFPGVPGAVFAACNTRNTQRKDNEYFSFDWRLSRPIKFGERFAVIPTLEMFNSFNNNNNVNPLSAPALFNFDGFLRQGVGDPLQVQFSIRLRW